MIIWLKIRILGIGSYGVVILGAAMNNTRLVAIKSSRSLYLAQSLRKEAYILKLFIGCQEIIQVIEGQIQWENGNPIHNLLMEYAPHGSLLDLIKKKPLSEQEVRIYTRRILKALSVIHQRGIVHCNLKSSNILLFPSATGDDYYHVKIGDFGLSKIKDEQVNAYFEPRGTPPFVLLESGIVSEIDTPLDIWSLGCIVIEMIMGSSFWCNFHDPTKSMMKESPKITHGVSKDCEDFLRKCFVINPTERWTADMLLKHPFLPRTFDDFFASLRGLSSNFTSFFSYNF